MENQIKNMPLDADRSYIEEHWIVLRDSRQNHIFNEEKHDVILSQTAEGKKIALLRRKVEEK